MTHHSEHTSNGSITCLSTDNYKRKRLRGMTIYKSLRRVQDHSWGNKLLTGVQAVLLVRQMSHLQNINKANVSTKVLNKTCIRFYHTCICIKKVMWGLVAASQLWLSGYPVLRQRETSLRWGSAHESTNHHINTLLWIHSCLPTRRPSIALTLVLSILEYPLQVVYVPRKHPRSP